MNDEKFGEIAKNISEILTNNLGNKITMELGNGLHTSILYSIKQVIEDGNDTGKIEDSGASGSEQPIAD